jgi:hypothetical protein
MHDYFQNSLHAICMGATDCRGLLYYSLCSRDPGSNHRRTPLILTGWWLLFHFSISFISWKVVDVSSSMQPLPSKYGACRTTLFRISIRIKRCSSLAAVVTDLITPQVNRIMQATWSGCGGCATLQVTYGPIFIVPIWELSRLTKR